MNVFLHRLLVPVCTAALMVTPGQAADPDATKRDLAATRGALQASRAEERELAERQRKADAELTRLRQQAREIAGDALREEAALTVLEDEIAVLDRDLADKAAALQARWAQSGPAWQVMLAMARFPPEGMIVLPARPVDTVRTVMIARALVETVEERAQAIRKDLVELAALRQAIDGKRADRSQRIDALRGKTETLARLQKDKSALIEQDARKQQALAARNRRLAAQAKDLADLVDRLIREREETMRRLAAAALRAEQRMVERVRDRQAETDPAETQQAAVVAAPTERIDPLQRRKLSPRMQRPDGIRNFDGQAGRLWKPVGGRVVRRYGARDGVGMTSKGLTIESRVGAPVVAPFDGKIVFAGPFRGYGLILLIEHSGGYHMNSCGPWRLT